MFRVAGLQHLARLGKQCFLINPFSGNCKPQRVPLLRLHRPSLPFPHPWNYRRPIEILESYFGGAERDNGCGRHNRYFELPGMYTVLVTRDPAVIRAILTETGDREGQFDRDTLPSIGIARATGEDTLLFGNGALWRRQRQVSASPFGKTALFQVDVFMEFESTFRNTVLKRLAELRRHMLQTGVSRLQVQLEPEIKAVMLEMLVECFFGAKIEYEELRNVYIPALERVIDHIVRDTVVNRLGVSRFLLAKFSRRYAEINRDFATFDELTERMLSARQSGRGLWKRLRTEAPDDALRSNIKVFLAGALEATTSFATWAISHLARNESWQERIYAEVEAIADYSPEQLDGAHSLNAALEETLRLTPSLYFLPRRASVNTRIELPDGREMVIPRGTHILLDIWHANRHEDHWGVAITGYSADEFAPERWHALAERKARTKEFLHFGFGHGPRVCPGKHLGQLEVALVVGVFVKLFRFRNVHATCGVHAGVSTKPADGALVELELRPPSAGMTTESQWQEILRDV
ncbi:MAG TPA: cytochrome P450 [Pirellulaceae bacterium]|nr:cytochrome P450 [Pirellulaceae bacterium]HMP69382.1 cytochrome P450 [Pirellulaceae bacterium]